jgi:hypothetical protein
LSRPLSAERLCSANLSSRYTRMSRRRNACPFNPSDESKAQCLSFQPCPFNPVLSTRMHQTRKADFRRGRRLGPGDHIVTWRKSARPDWMSPAEYAAMPDELRLREIRVRVKGRTKRTRELVIVTTLLDAKKYSASALQDLFRQRWNAELDIRSIKTTMGM